MAGKTVMQVGERIYRAPRQCADLADVSPLAYRRLGQVVMRAESVSRVEQRPPFEATRLAL